MGTSVPSGVVYSDHKGSPPRVWGQDRSLSSSFASSRITPTRMGTSTVNKVSSRQRRDHPHAYGDKCSSTTGNRSAKGSPPRVWGQEFYLFVCGYNDRITPTRMGTRPKTSSSSIQPQDHPHAYGDKSLKSCRLSLVTGSPPRVWGQALSSLQIITYVRITPTRMGTSAGRCKF